MKITRNCYDVLRILNRHRKNLIKFSSSLFFTMFYYYETVVLSLSLKLVKTTSSLVFVVVVPLRQNEKTILNLNRFVALSFIAHHQFAWSFIQTTRVDSKHMFRYCSNCFLIDQSSFVVELIKTQTKRGEFNKAQNSTEIVYGFRRLIDMSEEVNDSQLYHKY